jgi:transposase
VTGVGHQQIGQTATVQAAPASRAARVRRWLPGATRAAAYAAGLSACVRPRALTTAGITPLVVPPASIAVAAPEKVQTARRDATRRAVDLADGRRRGLSGPPEEEELARLLPRPRAPLVEPRAPLARPSKATRPPWGLIAPSRRRRLRPRSGRALASGTLPPARRARLQLWAEPWRLVTRQLLERRRRLRAHAPAPAAIDQGDRRGPGLGEVVARTLATARGDLPRWAHERARCSSPGLTPSASASGASVRRGPLSRPGSRRGRHLLVATAWRALPYDAVLHTMLERRAATRGKHRALVAMARRLSGRRRACCRPGTLEAVGTVA